MDMKKAIAYNVSRCVDTLVEEARQEQIDSANYLSGLIRLQRILTAAVVIIALIMMTVTLNMVIYPIEATVNSIRNDEKLTPCGSREMRFLIDTYNNMYDRNSQNQSRLSYEASHDPLTGLYNRSVFKSVLSDSHEGGIGLMIIDIDHFKEVNDTYGHDAGDKVLKRVSSELQSHFRSEDYICRIGGDEFAVIMAHAGSELKDLVHMKAVLTAEGLRKDKNEVLGVTLSIGAAFSDEVTDEEDSLYKCADKALYQTKEKGKDGITFFGDLEDKTI